MPPQVLAAGCSSGTLTLHWLLLALSPGTPATLLCCLHLSSTQQAVGVQVQYLLQTSTLLISMKRKELRHRARQRARDEAANSKKHS